MKNPWNMPGFLQLQKKLQSLKMRLIIRNKIYTSLKDEMVHIRKKPNYMTVPAAIKELEKIEMIHHPDGTYGLYSGATSKQKSILKAFGIDTNYLKHLVTKLSVVLRETEGGNQ